MITVFTPTYNRAYTLPKLYESLKNQSSNKFQWLVIDDGSSDNTEKLIESYKKENKIEIIYKKIKNGGKMRAINKGVELSLKELFFIVDSDDYLHNKAIEKILASYENLPKEFAGMVFRKKNIKEEKELTVFPNKPIDSTPIEIFYNKKILGDKAEVFKTSILKEKYFIFPEIKGEKFVPEGLIWNRIGKRYNLRYINEIIYYFEYIQDGYTKNFNKLIKENPEGFKLYYKEMLTYPIPFYNKIKFLLRYIESCIFSFLKKGEKE
ncbi:MAG: glycosyltransferase family 2 protein [Fusobacteriaceae bacterium]